MNFYLKSAQFYLKFVYIIQSSYSNFKEYKANFLIKLKQIFKVIINLFAAKILSELVQLIILIMNTNCNQVQHFHQSQVNSYCLILYQFFISLNLMNLINQRVFRRSQEVNRNLNQ